MNFIDNLPMYGEVLITATDANTGEQTVLLHDKNLIVLNGRNNIGNMLAGTTTGNAIYDIAFGTGGTVAGSPSQVLSVSPTQLTVNTPIAGLIKGTDYTFSIDSSAIPTTTAGILTEVRPSLIFNIAIPSTPTNLNGIGISEMALMMYPSTVPTAFAIKCFSTINKSSSISIVINWTIYL